jgi:hypothetical protein
MQHQPSHAPAWLKRSLAITAAIAVVWALGALANGYRLGYPPTGLEAVPCAHTLRVDFVVPMWKPASSGSVCAPASSSSAPAIPAGENCDLGSSSYAGEAICSWYR